jgi:hypothetical protein
VFYPSVILSLERASDPVFAKAFETEFERKKLERENVLKRQQLMAKAAQDKQAAEGGSGNARSGQQSTNVVGAGVKSVEALQQEVEKELDRQ